MRKKRSQILSLLLVCVLVLSAANVAYAEELTEPAGETKLTETEETDAALESAEVEEAAVEEPAEAAGEDAVTGEKNAVAEETAEVRETGIEADTAVDAREAAQSVLETAESRADATIVNNSIPYYTVTTGKESVSKVGLLYWGQEEFYTLQDGYLYPAGGSSVKDGKYGYSRKITFKNKGTVILTMAYLQGNGMQYGVYTDENMTKRVGTEGSISQYSPAGSDGVPVSQLVVQIPKAGTYYLGVYSTSIGQYPQGVSAVATYINGGDRTITSGKQIAVGHKNAQTNYFKFKAASTGYLTIKTDVKRKIAICNSKKTALSGWSYSNSNFAYGVKKGVTYYIKVYATATSDGGYILKATNTKVTEKSGSKQSKAVTLSRNTTKKGTITAGSSQADWYKIKLTGSRKVVITVTARTNSKFKVTLKKGSKTLKSSTMSSGTLTFTSAGKLSKGTYTICIARANTKSSGYYTVKWK